MQGSDQLSLEKCNIDQKDHNFESEDSIPKKILHEGAIEHDFQGSNLLRYSPGYTVNPNATKYLFKRMKMLTKSTGVEVKEKTSLI